MRLLFFEWYSITIAVYTIMGMLVGVEFDDENRWMSINLLLLKITITMDTTFLDNDAF